MAKQSFNFFEVHLEKIVVAAAVLLLGWVIYAYGVTSPNKIELKGQMVHPGNIDAEVRQTAESVFSALRQAKVERTEIPDYPAELLAHFPGPLEWEGINIKPELPLAVSFGLPVPEVYGPQAPGQITLATVVAPEKPEVTTGRFSAVVVRELEIGDEISDQEWEQLNLDGPKDLCWVTVGAKLDLRRQQQVLLEHNYQTNRFAIFGGRVLLQRQSRQPDGRWGEWTDIDGYSEFHLQPDPVLTVVKDASDEWVMPEPDRLALAAFQQTIVDNEKHFARPQLPPAEHGPPWTPPLQADLARLYPDEFTQAAPAPSADGGRKLTAAQQARADFEAAEKAFNEGRLEDALRLVELVTSNSKAGAALARRADALRTQIQEQLQQAQPPATPAAGSAPDGEPLEELPTEQVYLAHDLTAEPGGVYRYRMKIQAYNQYAGIPSRLKNPVDATLAMIDGEWSPPSDPVRIPVLQHIFLTSVREEKNEARFDVYKWVKGVWQKQQLNAEIGERVQGTKRLQVDGKRVNIEFDTLQVLLDIVPGRTYVPLSGERDGSVVAARPVESVAVLLVDDRTGRVTERVLEADKDDPHRALVERASREAKP